ncbi:MAG TPA: hypothetical protein VHA10_18640 [Hypericibacter adhaerens]|uniref:hypothetical protein n=1 Tax=Hypericibacter adhaerens TaxID=2602016 RepID=UPI002CDD7F8E|nr:hypothetical protein [Hypericibacter adhaerens]HWA45245.1 hypothetical protein [Hypericibacter adhaerens]
MTILGLVVGYPIVGIGLETLGKGLSFSEMDWNGDGHTTVGEFFDTMNVGVSRVEIDGNACRHVYAFKDGRPVKTLCP